LLPRSVEGTWQIRAVLEGVGEWEWNVFDLVKVAKGHELKITGWCVQLARALLMKLHSFIVLHI
jgi:hypothetical protein